VKYFIELGKDVPKMAQDLHAKAEVFRVQARSRRCRAEIAPGPQC